MSIINHSGVFFKTGDEVSFTLPPPLHVYNEKTGNCSCVYSSMLGLDPTCPHQQIKLNESDERYWKKRLVSDNIDTSKIKDISKYAIIHYNKIKQEKNKTLNEEIEKEKPEFTKKMYKKGGHSYLRQIAKIRIAKRDQKKTFGKINL